MHPYPYSYTVSAAAQMTGLVTVTSSQLPDLQTAPPPEFDGPGGVWSPETLLCAAVADCFILTFRAVSRAGRLEWLRLDCRVEGILERGDRMPQFTRFTTFVELVVPPQTDTNSARKLLEQAEHGCLIANSLRGTRSLETHITVNHS